MMLNEVIEENIVLTKEQSNAINDYFFNISSLLDECENDGGINYAAEQIVDYFMKEIGADGSPIINLDNIAIPSAEFYNKCWSDDEDAPSYYDGVSQNQSSGTKAVDKEVMVKLVKLHLEFWI
jgi:hypothetical protein